MSNSRNFHLSNPRPRATASSFAFSLPALLQGRSKWWRTLFVGLLELGLVVLIGGMFWHQDWRYSLPTPRPPKLIEPTLGAVIAVPAVLGATISDLFDRPVLLHFFNPDCPCSRFNLDHVRSLHRQFSGKVNFVAVLEGTDSERLRQQYARLDLPVPAIVDADQSVAGSLGVYSTPQAVLLDRQQRLCYRGNYNTSRFCTVPQTEFARLALESMLMESRNNALLPAAATTAYGCSLPIDCRKAGAP